jgi:hypothetical protein
VSFDDLSLPPPDVSTFAPPPDVSTFAPPPDVSTFAPPPDVSTFAPPPDVSTFAPPPDVSTFASAPDLSTLAAVSDVSIPSLAPDSSVEPETPGWALPPDVAAADSVPSSRDWALPPGGDSQSLLLLGFQVNATAAGAPTGGAEAGAAVTSETFRNDAPAQQTFRASDVEPQRAGATLLVPPPPGGGNNPTVLGVEKQISGGQATINIGDASNRVIVTVPAEQARQVQITVAAPVDPSKIAAVTVTAPPGVQVDVKVQGAMSATALTATPLTPPGIVVNEPVNIVVPAHPQPSPLVPAAPPPPTPQATTPTPDQQPGHSATASAQPPASPPPVAADQPRPQEPPLVQAPPQPASADQIPSPGESDRHATPQEAWDVARDAAQNWLVNQALAAAKSPLNLVLGGQLADHLVDSAAAPVTDKLRAPEPPENPTTVHDAELRDSYETMQTALTVAEAAAGLVAGPIFETAAEVGVGRAAAPASGAGPRDLGAPRGPRVAEPLPSPRPAPLSSPDVGPGGRPGPGPGPSTGPGPSAGPGPNPAPVPGQVPSSRPGPGGSPVRGTGPPAPEPAPTTPILRPGQSLNGSLEPLTDRHYFPTGDPVNNVQPGVDRTIGSEPGEFSFAHDRKTGRFEITEARRGGDWIQIKRLDPQKLETLKDRVKHNVELAMGKFEQKTFRPAEQRWESESKMWESDDGSAYKLILRDPAALRIHIEVPNFDELPPATQAALRQAAADEAARWSDAAAGMPVELKGLRVTVDVVPTPPGP